MPELLPFKLAIGRNAYTFNLSCRGVADGQVGPVLTGPLFSQTEFFSLAKVYFTHGVPVLASVQFDLNSVTERPTAAAAFPVI